MKFKHLFLFLGGLILLIILLLQMFNKRENFKPKPKPNKTTITCVKGNETKKITAVNPTCPEGYKKK